MDSRLRRLLIKERIELLERCPNKIPVSSLRRPYNKDFYRASRMFNWETAFTEIRPEQGTTPLSRKIPDGIIWCLNKYVAAVTECRLAGTLSWDDIGKIETLSLEELVRILPPIEVGEDDISEDDITVADLEEYIHRNRASRRSQRSRTTVPDPDPNRASIEPPKMHDVARRKWRDSLSSVDVVTNDHSKTDNAAPKRVPASVRPTWGSSVGLPASNETAASKLGARLSVTLLSDRDAPAPKNNNVRTDGGGRTRVRPTWGSSVIVSNDLHDAKFAIPHSGHCVPDKDAAKAKCNIVGTVDRARVRVRPTWDCPALPLPTATLNLNDVAKLDVPPCGPRIPDTDAAKAVNRQMIADGRRVRPTWGSAAVLSNIATNGVPSTLTHRANSTSISVNKDAPKLFNVRTRVRPTWDCATVSNSYMMTSDHVSNLKVPAALTKPCSTTGASLACPSTSSLVGGPASSLAADPTNVLPLQQIVARQPSRCAATLLCTTPRSRRVENSRAKSPTATVTNSEESTTTTQTHPPPKPKRGQWRKEALNDVTMGDEQPTELDVGNAELEEQSGRSDNADPSPAIASVTSTSTKTKGTRFRAKRESRTASPTMSPRRLRPRKPVNYAEQEESTQNVRRGRKPPASAPKKREKKPALRSRKDTKQGSTVTEKGADSKDENEQSEPQASGSRNVVPSVQVPPRDRDLFSSDDDLDDEPLPSNKTFVLKVVTVVTGQERDAETDSAYGSRPVSREDHIPGIIGDVPDTFSSAPQTRASRRSEWTGTGGGANERSPSSPKVSLGASPVASGSRSTRSRSTASSVASGSSDRTSPTQVTPPIGTAVPSTSPVLQDSMMTPKMKKKEKRRRSLSRSLSRSVARVSRFFGLTTKK